MGIIILIVVNIQKKSTMQDKRPLNDKNQAHGYWEVYYPNGNLHFKGLFVNSHVVGPYEAFYEKGGFIIKANFFNGKTYGFCEHLENKMYYAR
jgi:antitoxin component YwqK of YwqJK toxin-antitoxin module